MGRDATKAATNPWYQARMKEAEHNDKLRSREGAADLLNMSVSSLADAELGLYKFMPADKVVRMAELYNAPYLENYHCLKECPIGLRHAISDEVCDLDRITIKLVKKFNEKQLAYIRDTLVDIAEDGKITEDETEEFKEIVNYLSEVAKSISELKIITDTIFGRGEKNGCR